MNPVELRIGVEIETHIRDTRGVLTNLVNDFDGWRIHSEGSIPGGGWEVVSPRLPPKRLPEVKDIIDKIVAAGGSFPEASNIPKSLEQCEEQEGVNELLPLLEQARERERLNPDYIPVSTDEIRAVSTYEGWIEARRQIAAETWENIQGHRLRDSDRKRDCCSMHIHVGTKTCKSKKLNRKLKGTVEAIYSFYYKEFIEPNLPICRKDKGSASHWCKIYHPENEDMLYIGSDRTGWRGDRYYAVNVSSEHKTVEFRQPSIGPTSKLDADGWIELCSTIYKAGWYFFHLKDSPDTVASLKARLPGTLDGLREWITKIEEEPEKFLDEEPPKPKKRTKKVNETLTDTFITPEALEEMMSRKIATVFVEKR